MSDVESVATPWCCMRELLSSRALAGLSLRADRYHTGTVADVPCVTREIYGATTYWGSSLESAWSRVTQRV